MERREASAAGGGRGKCSRAIAATNGGGAAKGLRAIASRLTQLEDDSVNCVENTCPD